MKAIIQDEGHESTDRPDRKLPGRADPKPLLEKSGLGEEVELEVADGTIVIRSARVARDGWEEAFRAMAEQGDDALLDPGADAPTEWDEVEWEW